MHTLTVAEVQRLTSDSVAVTFDVPADLSDRYEFRPGQFLTLCREIDGRDERRSYSICAPVGRRPRVGVRLVPGGRFSQWLVNEVRPGDRIDVATPAGTFTPEPGQADHHVLVAAGSGITPVLSIASSLLATSDATVTLLYGNRRADTVMFADELADLKDEYPCRLHLVHVLSRESREPELFSGRLDQDKLRTLCRTLIPMDEVAHWWLCGPYEMVTGAQKVLGELNVPADRVHRELFYVEDTPPATVHHDDPAIAGQCSNVTVVLDGRSSTVPVSKDHAVLDGAQRYRPDLPFACRGGVCGTCRARVRSGQVDMERNFALEPDEIAAGFVLTCQSRPVSDEVVLDFDSQ